MKIAAGLLAALAMLATPLAAAQGSARTTRPLSPDDLPCPQMPVVSPERMALIVEPKPHVTKTPPASKADRTNYMQWLEMDPDGVCRYREENRRLPAATAHRVVFIGDSITEAWRPSVPSLFTGDVLDRGVSGQTTTQMLARFRLDVVDLLPAVVHIMGGVNDIQGLSGTALFRSNIASMVELARANDITVIIGAITPSSLFQGSPDLSPGAHIAELNRWLRDYAGENDLIYVDYHSALQDGRLGIKAGLSNDGLHPNRLGFEEMSPLARAAMDQAFNRRAERPAR